MPAADRTGRLRVMEAATGRRPRSVTAALLTDLLAGQLAAWRADAASAAPQSDPAVSDPALHIVDLGGGTGGPAAALAGQGHRVTVVDPSPDALAALKRRAAEAGLAELLVGVQGDAAQAAELLGTGAADVVVCHQVLEYVDDPAEALAGIARLLRPGGLLSLAVALRPAAVLAQAWAGHLDAARRALTDPRRLDRATVLDLVSGAGFTVTAVHGVGAVAALVHESVLHADPDAWTELSEIERRIATEPDFQAIAPQLHVAARRPG